jgi:hypothetical protein
MFAKNKSDLINKLKALEGKAVLKLTRVQSLNDGEFLRILQKIKTNSIVFVDDTLKECSLEIPKVKDLEILENGFRIKNCTYELVKIM